MEESIGYEDLLSPEELDSLDLSYWDEAEDMDLTPLNGDAVHDIRIYETKDGFEVECELCGSVGSAEDRPLAELLERFHTTLGAMTESAS